MFFKRLFTKPYCTLLCCLRLVSLGKALFSKVKQRAVDLGVGRLRGVERGKAEVRIYCMREE